MFLRIGDQQFGLLPGGFFTMGCTPLRPPVGTYAPATEIAFLQRYVEHLEREMTDLDHRLAMLGEAGAPVIERTPDERPTVTAG